MLLKVTIMHEYISQIWQRPKIWNPEIRNRPFHIPENLREYLWQNIYIPLFIYLFTLEFWQKFATKRTLAGWSVLSKYGEFGISSLIMWRNSFALFISQIIIIAIYHCHLHFFFLGSHKLLPGVLCSLPPARSSLPLRLLSYHCACFVSCLRYKMHFASPCLAIIFHFVAHRPSLACFFLGRSVAFAFQIPTSCMIQLFDSLLYIFFFLS